MVNKQEIRATRRAVMVGGAVLSAGTSVAAGVLKSPRPEPRPARFVTADPPAGLIEAAGLSGISSYVVADATSGEVLAAHRPAELLPPASVLKSVTALYGLAHLGGAFRFRTRVVAVGTLREGKLLGDIVLTGGGDPSLGTDDLADLARQLKAGGVFEVTGRFLVYDRALPIVRQIDTDQPDYVGYNPAISGLNLNNNRVYFEWRPASSGYQLTMDARSANLRPEVQRVSIRAVDRERPVYRYSGQGTKEKWTVSRAALGKGGGRWLPVRQPALYAAEVFQTLAGAHGWIHKRSANSV